jgi:hypothetical protein
MRTPNMADKVVIIGASRGQDWRLLNFYREARPKDCQLHREGANRFFRISPIAITLSRPITRASHTGTGRTSNTFADTFDHGPGIVNQFTEKLGFLALHALQAGLRQLSHGLLGPKEAPAVEGAMAGLGGRIGRRAWTRSRSPVKERTPFTNLLSLPNNADTPCAKQPERGSL